MMVRAATVASAVALVFALVIGCSGGGDSSNGGSSDGGIGTPGADANGSSSGDSSLSDAGSGGLCNSVQQDAPKITTATVATPAPAQTGGTVSDGKYFLTAYTVYTTGPGITPFTVGSTLVITGNVFDNVTFDGNTGKTFRSRSTFTTNGTTFTNTPVCFDPPVSGPLPTSNADYSADATTFTSAITSGSSTIVGTYTKQ